MQNEQRLLQPSWIFRLGRVRSPAASSTGRGEEVVLGENVADQDIAVIRGGGHQFGDLRLVGISHHPFDAGHGGQFIGRALGIAASDQNARVGVLAMYPAHGLAHVFVGGLGDRTGIQDHQVRVAALGCSIQPLGRKQGFERGAIGLGGPAAEVLDEELTHCLHYRGCGKGNYPAGLIVSSLGSIMATSRKKRSIKWILLIVVPLLGGAAFFTLKAIGRNSPKIDQEKLVKAERIDLARSVVATGKIEAVTKVEIKSKASGIIQNLPVNVGDVVHKGQVICKLDENNVLPQVRQFQAALQLAEANLKSAEADYERYKVDAAGPDVPFLKRDMDRARGMYQEQLIARSLVDDSEKNYDMAVNRQKSAVVNLGVAQAAIAKAKAGIEQARAALAQSEDDLSNTTIFSPIDGVVLSRDREVGDAVSSILTMGSGATLIMTVGDLSEVYVKGKVDETDVGKIYLGQPARITVESFKDEKFNGKVTKISPMGVEKDNVTTFEVRVSISNESRKLRAEMTANAEIILEERKGVIAVPEGAILYNKDKSTSVEIPDSTSETGKRKIAGNHWDQQRIEDANRQGHQRRATGDPAIGAAHGLPSRATGAGYIQPAAEQAAQFSDHVGHRLGRSLDRADRGHGRRLQAGPAQQHQATWREYRAAVSRPD